MVLYTQKDSFNKSLKKNKCSLTSTFYEDQLILSFAGALWVWLEKTKNQEPHFNYLNLEQWRDWLHKALCC